MAAKGLFSDSQGSPEYTSTLFMLSYLAIKKLCVCQAMPALHHRQEDSSMQEESPDVCFAQPKQCESRYNGDQDLAHRI